MLCLNQCAGPDAFMFRQFQHHESFRTRTGQQYFSLSGGANMLPTADAWKYLLRLELEYDYAYRLYTAERGFPLMQRAVSLWTDAAAHGGKYVAADYVAANVCMTFGATQAATAVFNYMRSIAPSPKALFVGLNYSLFDRLARYYGFQTHEVHAADLESPRVSPPVELVVNTIERLSPDLIVLVEPNNPSGEQYNSSELRSILQASIDNNALLLLDVVGQMPIAEPWRQQPEAVIAQTGSFGNVVLINSFSKSDSIPGFRLGYLVGPKPVVEHVGRFQMISTMNPPTIPALAMVLILAARIIDHGRKLRGWDDDDAIKILSKLLTNIRELSSASTSAFAELYARIEPEEFAKLCRQYEQHQIRTGHIIQRNHDYAVAALRPAIERVTDLDAGFNFVVQLAPLTGTAEDAVCRALIDATGVAIMTEACFRITKRIRQNYWVRISLAHPEQSFRNSIDSFAGILGKLGKLSRQYA